MFKALRTDWTPVFTGVTASMEFLYISPFAKGGCGDLRDERVFGLESLLKQFSTKFA